MKKMFAILLIIISIIVLFISAGLYALLSFSSMGACNITDYPSEIINHDCLRISGPDSCVPYIVTNNCDKDYFILPEGLGEGEELLIEKNNSIQAIPKIDSESNPPWQFTITDKAGEEIVVKGTINNERIENNAKLTMLHYASMLFAIVSLLTLIFSVVQLAKKK